MTVKLLLSKRKVDCIIEEFGDRVQILDIDKDDYVTFTLELTNDLDALRFFHAGEEAGFVLGAYGFGGRPKKEKV